MLSPQGGASHAFAQHIGQFSAPSGPPTKIRRCGRRRGIATEAAGRGRWEAAAGKGQCMPRQATAARPQIESSNSVLQPELRHPLEPLVSSLRTNTTAAVTLSPPKEDQRDSFRYKILRPSNAHGAGVHQGPVERLPICLIAERESNVSRFAFRFLSFYHRYLFSIILRSKSYHFMSFYVAHKAKGYNSRMRSSPWNLHRVSRTRWEGLYGQ